MAGSVDIYGLKELRKSLKGLENEREWAKALSGFNRDLARDVAGWSNSAASAMGGQQAHFAGAFRGYATATAARVEIAGPRSPRGKFRAAPAFWGRKSHNAKGKPWIGASWDVGISGQGPYALNDTIARRSVEIDARIRKIVDDIAGGAFDN
jgi:hypothetical protein